MSRGLTASVIAALQSGTFRPIVFFKAEWGNGDVYVWSGVGSIDWNGSTWLGVGDFGTFTPIPEATDTTAQGFSVSLSGLNSALISDALSQAKRGLLGTAWLGFMDDSGNVIADPYAACSGRLDQPQIDQNPANPTLTINYETRLVDLERARVRRFDPADQAIDYPGDKGFDFVASIQQWSGTWGS